jgi:hypothetical protein
MKTIENIKLEILWESNKLFNLKKELATRTAEGRAIECLHYWIEKSQIDLHLLQEELAELEG